ncbi:hypothetical protein As57867_000547, partial [Aphanomyces stellatus]
MYCPPEMAKVILGHTGEPLSASPKFDIWCAAVIVLVLFGKSDVLREFLHVPDDKILDVIAAPGFSFHASIAATELSPSKQARLAKCLEIEPTKRGTLDDLRSLLPPTSTIVRPSGVTRVYDAMTRVHSSLEGIHMDVQSGLRLNAEVLAMTQATLAKVVETKVDLMRGIFEATEVAVPTSFIVLPFHMADQRQQTLQPPATTVKKTMGFLQRMKFVGANIVAAVKESNPLAATKAALDGFTQGQPMYLYLLDEVTGAPVEDDAGIYPIKIDTASDAYTKFMATNLPLFQRVFKFRS